MRTQRTTLSPRIRFEVLKRDKFTCQYCGRSGCELEVDHIQPISKGGTNDMDNLITACVDCNRGKSNIEVIPNTQAPIGYIYVKEPKSRRLNLLIRPSTADELKKIAKERDQSLNDFLNDMCEELIRQNNEFKKRGTSL